MALNYAVLLTPDDNSTLLVTCPDLAEVTTFGSDKADALRHARAEPAQGRPRAAPRPARSAVDRLLNPRHTSRRDQIEAALAAVGKRLVVDVEEAA